MVVKYISNVNNKWKLTLLPQLVCNVSLEYSLNWRLRIFNNLKENTFKIPGLMQLCYLFYDVTLF